MKQGRQKAIFSLLLCGCLTGAVFADSNTVEMESRILDSFDGTPYKIDGEEYTYTWKAVASKFTTKTDAQSFPVIGVIETAPLAISRAAENGDKTAKSLGVQGCFDRKGYNWIDIYPTASGGDGSPVEIPLLGRTRFIDVWVWGSNLKYTLEAYIRDNQGIIHVLPMGYLNYSGWKNLRAAIPSGVPMVSNIIPRSTHLTTFVKFRLWTAPDERTYLDVKRDSKGNILSIIPFYLYISQLKVLTDVYETVYDGDELANPKITDKLWGSESGGNAGGGTAGGGGGANAAPAAGN